MPLTFQCFRPSALCLRFRADQSGSIAIIMAVALVPLLLLLGLTLEMRQATLTRANLQTVLDQTVLNAAIDFSKTKNESKVLDTFSSNAGTVLEFETKHSLSFGSDRVSGTASTFVPAIFSGLIGKNGFDIVVDASATLNEVSQILCILTLDTNRVNSLIMNSGATINAPDCAIGVHSEAAPAVIFNQGITLISEETCLAGTNILNNSNLVDGIDFLSGCTPPPDPARGRVPAPLFGSCDFNGRVITGTSVTLSPGRYCGSFNLQGRPNIIFEPGLYIIREGDWTVEGGSWRGEGVTFYFEDSSEFLFNIPVDAELTPPASGRYRSVMIAEAPNLPQSDFILNDTVNFDVSGLIYLPSRNVTINSNGNSRSRDLLMVTNSLIMNNAVWDITNETAKETAEANRTVVRLIQ